MAYKEYKMLDEFEKREQVLQLLNDLESFFRKRLTGALVDQAASEIQISFEGGSNAPEKLISPVVKDVMELIKSYGEVLNMLFLINQTSFEPGFDEEDTDE